LAIRPAPVPQVTRFLADDARASAAETR